MAKKKKQQPELNELKYSIPDTELFDYGKEIIKHAKRKRFAKKLAGFAAFTIAVLVTISYLGYTLGQYFATATTMSLKTNAPQISLAEIGFRLQKPIDSTDSAKYGLVIDANNIPGDGYVYWTGQEVSSQTLSFILKHEGYSTDNAFSPVTARKFSRNQNLGQNIELFDSPRLITNIRENLEEGAALKEDYIGLDILFRLAVSNDYAGQVSLDNFGVYFTRDTKFTTNAELLKALRVGVSSKDVKDIISPGRKHSSSENYLGSINVGGRLDLDSSSAGASRYGYYDYSGVLEGRFLGEDGDYQYEIAYGDFETELTNDNWGSVATESGVIPAKHDTYNAATREGVRPLINFEASKQYYTNFEKYTLINGVGEPITYTNINGVAEFNMLIWLEGWDPSATINLDQSTFGAQLKFEVSKKDLEG